MPNTISNSLSLIGGAAAGAVAMYLLDPDQGADRRQDVGGTASDAVDATRSGRPHHRRRGVRLGPLRRQHDRASTPSTWRAGRPTTRATPPTRSRTRRARPSRRPARPSHRPSAPHPTRPTRLLTRSPATPRVWPTASAGTSADAAETASDKADAAVSAANVGPRPDAVLRPGRAQVGRNRPRTIGSSHATGLLDRAKSAGRRAVAARAARALPTATGITVGSVGGIGGGSRA